MALSQATRFLQFHSPLGDDVLLLTGFRGREEISRLFRFDLELISDDAGINAPAIVGKNVSFSVADDDDQRRFFNGHVSRFVAGDEDVHGRRYYRAEVVPWLWFLTRTSDLRIFQHQTVPQIIETIFGDLGFSDYELNLSGHHPEREYCVQYRETDFNFVSRLMEEEGIFYFFRHENGKHTLVLADSTSVYAACDDGEVDFPHDFAGIAITDHLTSWEHRFEFRTGKWAQQDYNFETPSTSLMTNAGSVMPIDDASKYEVYDYPGLYGQTSDGKPLTENRMEEDEVDYDVVAASSTCRSFSPGLTFTVGRHRSSVEEGKSFLITSIHHVAEEPLAYETGSGGSDQTYTNSFLCIPDAVIFRPARLTPKPVVQGIQTAVVVGPGGQEIYCDKYGRVKVQFHWDREGRKDENSSCWIRTAHNVAGKQWGFQAVPRIGQEVVVDFLEGDPDRPLIVGSVYNAEQMPHYTLPDHQTRTYIKTNSSLGGDGYNELMFEDKNDDERVYIHAQKNMDTRVRNDSKSRIFGNRHQIIGWEKDGNKGGDQRERVYQDKHLNIKRNHVEHIEGHMQLRIGHGEADDGGNLDIVLEQNRKEKVGGDSHLIIDGDHSEKVGGDYSQEIGGDLAQKVGGNVAAEAGSMGDIHLKAGMNVVIEAGMQLTLKGPGGFITIDPAGVTVQGMLVKINSGGSAGSGKGCSPKSPQDPEEAQPADPAMAFDSKTGFKSAPD
jgi:type VI secretion system secreted protein VgrG